MKDALDAVVLGPEEFALSLEAQGASAHAVEWAPPAAADALVRMYRSPDLVERVAAANADAVTRLVSARCRLVDIRRASDAIPVLNQRCLLHAGPPIDWESASGPLRGALIGAALLEGWAQDQESAIAKLAAGGVKLAPCHEHRAVGPMAGVISPSMPVFVVQNEDGNGVAYATINEGLGRVLRYGAYDAPVRDHLRWLARVVAPALAAVVRAAPVDLTSIIAQALQMGDELHNRNKAATALFARQISSGLVMLTDEAAASANDVSEILVYLARTDVFFLNLAMAASKCALDGAAGIKGSTLVTAMARNGTEFGIRCSGTGDRWFTAPAPEIEGLYFPGYGPKDANPDIGDSAITETAGLGGFALASAPAIVQFVGGSAAMARQITESMYEITVTEHPLYQMPSMDFRGTPTGIDPIRVCRTGIAPVLDTGIAHKEPGIGQIGAGIVRVPIAPFAAAVEAIV